ncbi:hypothetical protein MRX96_042793 [Rhipicephalus microplus]
MGWKHDLSRPVRDDCCRDPNKCCPYGYRCDIRTRNCVRITDDVRPRLHVILDVQQHAHPAHQQLRDGHSRLPLFFLVLLNRTLRCAGPGIRPLAGQLPTVGPNCQRVRGCRVTMGDQRYKSYRETFTRRPAYYGTAHRAAVPPAATVLALAASLRWLALYTSRM